MKTKPHGMSLKIDHRAAIPGVNVPADIFSTCNIEKKTTVTVDGCDLLVKKEYLQEVCILGYGSFGTVRKMLLKDTGLHFAVKELPLSNPETQYKRVIREANFAKLAFDYPFILKSYGCFVSGSSIWILMELMDGTVDTLTAKTHRLLRKFPERFIAYVTKCVVDGLEFLRHDYRIQHRDVKPSNILVSYCGQVKISDFGHANEMVNMTTETNVGTFMYQAPERLHPSPDHSGFRIQSDVWSLGLSVYKMATNDLPYSECASILSYERQVRALDSPTLPDSCSFSPRIHAFLAICLQKEEKNRPDFQNLLKSDFLNDESGSIACMSEFASFVQDVLPK